MPEEIGAAPATGSADAGSVTGPGDSTAVQQSTPASPDPGNAPGIGEATATGTTSPPPAKFRFLNREFDDQKRAEEALGAEVGRARSTQKELTALKQQLQQRDSEFQALRSMLVELQGRGPGQGPGNQAPTDPQSLADILNKDNGFKLYEQMALNPDIGVAGALYALARDMGSHYEDRFGKLEQTVEQRFASSESRREHEQAVARAMTATKALYNEFPELDESNQSPEALEAQEGVLEILQNTPQVPTQNGQRAPIGAIWLARQPDQALRWALGEYRRQHGVPIFAQQPGTSGSPSSVAARAAEAAAAAGSPEPLDGTGVPRPRPGGQPRTLEDVWRHEKPRQEARTPSGRRLGFPEPL